MEEGNSAMLKIPDEKEIRLAVFSLDKNKALSPNGFNAYFFQIFWQDIKVDICKFVQSFFRSSHLDPQVNQSAIILIPNKDKVENIIDFRPISLYNIFQKKKSL